MAHVGYIRVSSFEQNTARQLDGLKLDLFFEDRCSAKNVERPRLAQCLQYLRDGDTLHVHSIDRLARNLSDLRTLVADLTARGVIVRFEKEGLEFNGADTPISNLLFSMLGAVAEFERSLLLERQREGIALAKAAGKYKGRSPSLSQEKIGELRKRFSSGAKKSELAKEFGVSRVTVDKYLAV